MKYNKILTQAHPIAEIYPGCIIEFDSIIFKEGYTGNPVFNNVEVVLDLDFVEEQHAKGRNKEEKNQSMDSAFCITNNNNVNQIVLVEYKLNHDSFKFLKRADMEGKVQGSTEILAPYMPIYYHYFFVVQKELVQQAYSRFFRMNPKLGNEYIPICIHSLKDMFF